MTLADPLAIDSVLGSSYNDTIIGNINDNTLIGGGGDDVIVGVGGNNLIEGSVTRTVYLDFDTYELPGQHFYTPAERDAIQAQLASDYSAFSYVFTQTQPQSGPYTTIAFNDPALVGLEGGSRPRSTGAISTSRARRRWRPRPWRSPPGSGGALAGLPDGVQGLEVVPADSAGVNVNNFLGGPGDPAATSADFIGLSATIAAHELGHLSGLQHADSYGPIGSGIYAGVNPDLYNPPYPGPTDADETIDHIMASGASVNATLEDAINDPFFGEREAIALSYGENGSPTNEETTPHYAMSDAQPITLEPLVVPDTDLEGVNADMVFDVTAADVVGYLGETNGASNTDYYSFTAQAGTLINFQLMSDLLTRPGGAFDTTLTVYNSNGNVIAYNDDSFQDTDSTIIDLTLPTTGTYYIEVTASPIDKRPGNDAHGPETTSSSCTRSPPGPPRRTPTTPGLGDTIYAGSGDDTIFAGSADDAIEAQPQDTIVYGSGTVTILPANPSLNVSAGTNQMVNEGTSVTLTGSFLGPSGDTTLLDWHVVASSGQQIVDGTGSAFTFTPGNAGTYTVTLTVIDLSVGWDSADVVITSEDVPPVLTAPGASQSAFAGVNTSIDLGTLAVSGHWPVHGYRPVGRRPDLDLLTLDLRASLPGSHVCDGGDLHDRRVRLRVRRWHDDRRIQRHRDRCQHVDHAPVLGALRGLRPVRNVHGHGDGPGERDGSGGILLRAGQRGRSDRHRHARRGERPERGHLQHDGAAREQQSVRDHGRLRRRSRRPGQHVERRRRVDQSRLHDDDRIILRHGLGFRTGPHAHGHRHGERSRLGHAHGLGRLLRHHHPDGPGQRLARLRRRLAAHRHTPGRNADHHRDLLRRPRLRPQRRHALRDRRRPALVVNISNISPTHSAVSTIDVTFSEPINTSSLSPGALTLTDDGGPNLITGGVSLTLVSGDTYAIGGLGGLTKAQGLYTLTVNAADIQDQYGNPRHRLALHLLADGHHATDEHRQPFAQGGQ